VEIGKKETHLLLFGFHFASSFPLSRAPVQGWLVDLIVVAFFGSFHFTRFQFYQWGGGKTFKNGWWWWISSSRHFSRFDFFQF